MELRVRHQQSISPALQVPR